MSSFAVLALLAACGEVKVKPDGSMSDGDGGIDAPPQLRQVTVTVDVGMGGGSVTANVGDINCGTACSAMILDNTPITFTAVVPTGSALMGWRGDAQSCGAMPTCTVTVAGKALDIGVRFAKQATVGWNVHIGASGGGYMVGGDPAGNTYLVATHAAGAMFDGTTYPGAGTILAKVSPAGDVIWKKDLPAIAQIIKLAVVQQTGDVALLGGYMEVTDLGGPSPLTLPAGDVGDYFAVKFAGSDGHFLWQHPLHLDDADDPGVQGFAVNAAGDVLVAGAFNTSFDLGDGSVTTTAGLAEGFMGVLASADGALVWKKKIGGPDSNVYPYDAAFDSNGYVIIGGHFTGSTNLGGTVMTPSGSQDAFVARFFGTTGQLSWQRQIGGTGNDNLSALVIDTNNNVTVAVQYDVIAGQAVTFAGNTLAGTGTSMDIVVGQLSSVNAFMWAKRFGGTGGATPAGYDVPTDLVILADGNIALVGYFYSASLTFGATALANAGLTDAFIARLSPSTGDPSYAARLYGTGYDIASYVGRAGNNVVVSGRFQNQTNLLGTTLTAAAAYDGYAIAVPLP